MTGDKRLEPAVRRAIHYTLQVQDPMGGGWRYQPHDPGDTSQLGWQVMSLKSAELAGIAIPQTTARSRRPILVERCGGFAPRARPISTQQRSGEPIDDGRGAGVPRIHGLVRDPQTIEEASNFLMQELPGSRQTNLYFWYYATLALFQLQGDAWHRWNEVLQANLLATQCTDGQLAGSWDPDQVWGGCGGAPTARHFPRSAWKSTIAICRSTLTPRPAIVRRDDLQYSAIAATGSPPV